MRSDGSLLGLQTGRRGPAVRGDGGFSFMEIVVVMGAMAMLAALAVGYIGNIGKGTYLLQAKGMLSETAYRCITGSIGGRRAEFTLRLAENEEGDPVLKIGAIVARPVLTHQFETLEFASGAKTPGVNGQVEIVRGGGRMGNAARFNGGYLEFDPSPHFAMTEGIELDVWVQPEPNGRMMTLARAGESYEVALVQRSDSDSYDVRLTLALRKATDDTRIPAALIPFETSGGTSGPVVADGRWNRVQVTFHGLEPSIRVNGLESYRAGAKTKGRNAPGGAILGEELEGVRRIALPPGGVVPLTISSGERPYRGVMDGFRLMGVFRSEELERDLPGTLEVIWPTLPLRVAYANGALDPDVHNTDLVIRLIDTSNPDDRPLRLTLGMYGKVSSFFEKAGESGSDTRNPRLRGGSGTKDKAGNQEAPK